MKIVFLQDDFPPESLGGAGFSTYELALGMKKEGHEVFVITTCRKESEAGEGEYQGIKIHKIASAYASRWRTYRGLYNPSVVQHVERVLQKIQPDVVHINNVHFYLSYHCFKVSKKYANAVVFTARDTMSVCFGKLGTERYLKEFDTRTTWLDHVKQVKKGYNPLHNFLVKKYLAFADKRYAVSHSLQSALSENGITDVEVIHTGADVGEWGATEEEKAKFREQFDLEGKKIILFAGRLSEGKGGGKALDAFVQITHEVPNAVLLVAGSVDAYAEKMRERAREFGIGGKLVITGWIVRDMIRVAYAVADVVVVPSLYLDPFPRMVIEGMASGRPVVGTCYGGAPEIIVDGVTGYVVNPLHLEEIALKTIDLLKDSKKAEQFGRAGYERIKEDFNLEDRVKEYIVVYESLIQGKTNGGTFE